MIVADANLIAYFAIEGERTPASRRVFAKDRVWIAPELWRAEMLSILAGRIRRKEDTLEGTEQDYLYAESLMRSNTYPVDFRRVLAVVAQTGCSGYDSQYIALAEERRVKLVTTDGGILENAKHVAVSPEQFLAA